MRQIAKLEEIKIRGEQEDLAQERDSLESILASATKLKNLLKKELQVLADKFGDDRRSPLMIRKEAQALSEADFISSDPVTVILSEKGWIRAAKGHEVDPESLNYKSGDNYKYCAKGKSNQHALLLDSTGRSYAIPVHTLPSARGQGEPVSGRLNPPSGASFSGILMGPDKQKVVLSSDAGYGFVTTLGDLYTKSKAGKAVLTLPKGARVLAPCLAPVLNDGGQVQEKEILVVSISNEGRMLLFPLTDLPALTKGKGNKMLNIPAASVQARTEFVVAVGLLMPKQKLTIYSGKRHVTFKVSELDHYIAERGRRGHKLPRGFQKVDGIAIVDK